MFETDLRVIKTLENIDISLLKNLNYLSFNKITVDLICKHAKINRSTFYKYYKDKYDLLNKFIDKNLKEFTDNLNTEFINASPSNVEDLNYNIQFKKLLIMFSKNKEIYKTLWTASIDRKVYKEMTLLIQNAILENLYSNFNINPSKKECVLLFANLLASNVMTVANWYILNDNHISIDEAVNLMSKITSEGLFITLRKNIC